MLNVITYSAGETAVFIERELIRFYSHPIFEKCLMPHSTTSALII